MNKRNIMILMCGIYCACVVVSNVIVNKQIDICGFAVNTAMILFPIVYIINDLTVEVFGYKAARLLIMAGFFSTFIAVAAYQITLAIPGAASFQNQEAFEAVLGNTPRVFIASLLGYLAGSFSNAKVMAWMKKRSEKMLFARCMVSTIVGETLDAVVFVIAGFSFLLPLEAIVSLIVTGSLIKICFEAVMYPITKKAIIHARTLND